MCREGANVECAFTSVNACAYLFHQKWTVRLSEADCGVVSGTAYTWWDGLAYGLCGHGRLGERGRRFHSHSQGDPKIGTQNRTVGAGAVAGNQPGGRWHLSATSQPCLRTLRPAQPWRPSTSIFRPVSCRRRLPESFPPALRVCAEYSRGSHVVP